MEARYQGFPLPRVTTRRAQCVVQNIHLVQVPLFPPAMIESTSDKEFLYHISDRIFKQRVMSNDPLFNQIEGVCQRLESIADGLPDRLPKNNSSVQIMTPFEAEVKKAAEKAVLKLISEGSWLSADYSSRFKVPPEWMQRCWELIDKDKLQGHFARRLEEELANRMVNHMATEIATDVKQILSDKERRESLRALAREHMNALMGK